MLTLLLNLLAASGMAGAESCPTTPARAILSASAKICPGDLLLVRNKQGPGASFFARVDNNGMIFIPRVGQFGMRKVQAQGLKVAQVERAMETLLSQEQRQQVNLSVVVLWGTLEEVVYFDKGRSFLKEAGPGDYWLPEEIKSLLEYGNER